MEQQARFPVWVTIKMKDNRILKFDCWQWDFSKPLWEFLSFTRNIGRKELRVVNPSEVADAIIEAPEPMFDTAPRAAVAPQLFAKPSNPTLVPAMNLQTQPHEEINPLLSAVRENGALVSKPVKDRFGRPQAEIVSDLRGGVTKEVVGASMI